MPDTGEVEQRRRQVDQLDRLGIDHWLDDAGVVQDEGYPQAGLEAEPPVVEIVVVLAQRLAVVGGQRGDGCVQ